MKKIVTLKVDSWSGKMKRVNLAGPFTPAQRRNLQEAAASFDRHKEEGFDVLFDEDQRREPQFGDYRMPQWSVEALRLRGLIVRKPSHTENGIRIRTAKAKRLLAQALRTAAQRPNQAARLASDAEEMLLEAGSRGWYLTRKGLAVVQSLKTREGKS